MSYRALAYAWEQTELTILQKFVLVSLADQADDEGVCFPSQGSIARRCGAHRKSVNEVIGVLSKKGHVVIRKDKRGRTSYYMPLEKQEQVDWVATPADDDSEGVVEDDGGCRLRRQGVPSQTAGGAVSDGIHLNHQLTTNEPCAAPASPFDLFWDEYPRKTNKKKAREVWNRRKLNPRVDELIEAVRKQKRSEQWDIHRMIPHASTWLNGDRWEDDMGSSYPKRVVMV